MKNLTKLTIPTQSIELIHYLNQALVHNDNTAIHNFYVAINEMKAIQKYYMIKGLKQANEKTFFETIDRTTDKEFARDIFRFLLDEVYDFDDEDNYSVAYEGMGNLDAYTTAYKSILTKRFN